MVALGLVLKSRTGETETLSAPNILVRDEVFQTYWASEAAAFWAPSPRR